MTGKSAFLIAFSALALAGSLAAQTREDAKADGKAFGTEAVKKAREAASTAPDASRIPNYDPAAARSLEDLADDPDRIEGAALSAASAHAGYRAMQDSVRSRAVFDPQTIREVLSRSDAIGENPLDYTSGMAVTGSQGSCVQLPPGSGSAGTYTATCNTGSSGERRSASCVAALEPVVTSTLAYDYYCLPGGAPDGGQWSCHHYEAAACYPIQSFVVPCFNLPNGVPVPCNGGYTMVALYRCGEPVAPYTPNQTSGEKSVATRLDESQCRPLADTGTCTLRREVCTDSEPQTRVIEGVPVTRSCWAWQRDYECLDVVAGNDCADLEANGACRFLGEDCLTDEEPCPTRERIYECPLPASESDGTQYVCDGDVYCIDGSCETIAREANNEFKDAVTALHAMDEARGQFDPETLTLFRGTRNTCSSKVFGVLNCCKGKGFPLIPGISLLVAMGCDRAEVLLHERDAQGLCAYVGSYCSDSFLGVCLTKRKAYCCFESRLSRILQEQGRRQLPKPWDKPREETCEGFTLAEFARLDLSRMDFSEVYAEFTEAARLPDELETSTLLQQKIEDYYDRSDQ